MTAAGSVEAGRLKVDWARAHMPVLEGIRRRFERERPFAELTLSLVLHTEAKTAVLALALRAGGASVHLAAGNPLSTDDDAVAVLAAEGVDTHARKGESLAEYRAGIRAMLDADPDVIIDDGADLVALVHEERRARGRLRGSTEETTTGITRLRALERSRGLLFPAIDVNDADMKHLFDNRYGTGQSTIDGVLAATNLLLAGRTAVVAGYGWCGRGVAARLKGLGSDVIVTEVDPVRALEARFDGFRVMPMLDAAREADLIVTVTGQTGVVRGEHFKVLKDGCLLANAGHFDVEIARGELSGLSVERRAVRPNVEEFRFADGRRAYLLGDGRLVNLAAGQGHPVEVMDLSFALQALSAEHLARHGREMEPRVHPVPPSIDRAVAAAALPAAGIAIDAPTQEQVKYAAAWESGT
ncbi:MAG TPA: adenosylhomocysteinase [Thermoplasmata archaeon]|nr:adenosylhomocysteinase [Thermoplasmata archaeon]